MSNDAPMTLSEKSVRQWAMMYCLAVFFSTEHLEATLLIISYSEGLVLAGKGAAEGETVTGGSEVAGSDSFMREDSGSGDESTESDEHVEWQIHTCIAMLVLGKRRPGALLKGG